MSEDNVFEIKKYDFGQKLLTEIDNNHYVNGLWPLVYILSDGRIKEAYVGETTDALSRMSNHLKNNSKSSIESMTATPKAMLRLTIRPIKKPMEMRLSNRVFF